MDLLPDDPICERCTYPLLPPDRGKCPECGHEGTFDTTAARVRRGRWMGVILLLSSVLLSVSLNALIMEFIHPLVVGRQNAYRWVYRAQGTPNTPAVVIANEFRFVPTIVLVAGVIGAVALFLRAGWLAERTRTTRRLTLLTCLAPYYSGGLILIGYFLYLSTKDTIP
ncbi:MAG: hypothetical protein AAGI53_07130 [Planctomycetota bacterium]